MSFVIFDTEYTTWPGCQEKGWHGSQKREIVQLAALKVSDNLEVLDTLNLLCRPMVNPVLSDYFIGLTGITNEMVKEQGMPFEQAYRQFQKFVGKDKCLSHSFGCPWENWSDGFVVEENLKINQIFDERPLSYYNVAAWLAKQYQKNGIQNPPKSSGQIAKILGVDNQIQDLGLDEHNALYDVYSIQMGIRYFTQKFNIDFEL